jgi:hypothetical protein
MSAFLFLFDKIFTSLKCKEEKVKNQLQIRNRKLRIKVSITI